MSWQEDVNLLKQGGFTDDEIATEGSNRRQQLVDGGFSQKEVDGYFGVKEPDMTPVKNLIKQNLKKADEAESTKPKEAKTFLEYLDAGFQMSSSSMLYKAYEGRSVKPDTVLPEDAPTFARIASQAATLAGDLPAMVAGAFAGAPAGGAVGSAVPVVGTTAGALIGGGAGGNALPTAIRSTLMEYYEKGEVHDFRDFWERTSSVFIDTLKDTAIGGVSAGIGGKVLSAASKVAAPAVSRVASGASEVATMVAVGKGLEGEVPSAQDFIDASLLVGALHVGTGTASKIRKIYAKTGIKPHEVVQEAETNPTVKQDLLTNGSEIPGEFKKLEQLEMPLKTEETPAPKVDDSPINAQDKILSKIGGKAEPEKSSLSFNELYKNYVDKFDPIKIAEKGLGKDLTIPVEKSPYNLSRMANDAKAKALHFFEKGTLDYETLETTGKPFNQIIKPHEKDLGGFKAYLVSKRALELDGRGIKSGFDIEAAKEVIANGSKYEKAANELVEFQNNAVKYLKDAGFLSEKSYKAMLEANKNYISFKRVMEGGEVSKGSKKKPIHKIKGSDLSIQDPFLSLMDNTQLYLEMAESNRAKRALIELAEKSVDQDLIQKVKEPVREIEISPDELNKALTQQGLSAEATEGFSVFRKNTTELAKDEFSIFRDGKREVYKTDLILAEAIRNLDGVPMSQNLAFKLMRGITSVKRLAITLSPEFQLKNAFRDLITAGTFSKTNISVIGHAKDTIIAMGDLISKNDNYYNWLKSGGANGAFIELGENYLKKDIYKLDKEAGNFLNQTWNTVKTVGHALEVAGKLIEQAPRLAEAKRVMAGQTKGAKVFEAGMAARELTLDFQRSGAKIAALNTITAFQNAAIQGLDKTARALKEDPAGIAKRATLSITLPSILLWWSNKDDKRVQDLPRYQKDLFWIIPTDNWVKAEAGEGESLPDHLTRVKNGQLEINKGEIYRIPKPQELGLIFGTLPERIMDTFFKENSTALKDFEHTVFDLLTPAVIPDAVAPFIEQYFNESFFTQNEIIPGHLEGVVPELQYKSYTSETAKAVSKMILAVPYINEAASTGDTPFASPAVLENYVRSWTGNLGDYAIKILDQGLIKSGIVDDPVRPESTLSDIPFFKAFVARYPSAGSQSMTDFREKFKENLKFQKSIDLLIKSGQGDLALKWQMREENQQFMLDLSGMDEAIGKHMSAIHKIYINKNIEPFEKRQLIDGLTFGAIEISKKGLQLQAEWEKNLKEQKKNVEANVINDVSF